MTRLQANEITLSYGGPEAVIPDLTLKIPDGAVTAIIGPNGCGKSTLLRALGRLMAPQRGAVLLDGHAIHRQSTKEVARQLGLLPQQPTAPDAITVEDLVRRGRYPHQSLLQPMSREDRAAVERALEVTGMTDLRRYPVDELSGGQRQRAWIAMALAQETPLLLLDEPTTYLDIAHQQEILSLLRRLNRTEGRTIVMVLHDVNAAAQVSDHVVAMRDGGIVAEGPPERVLTPEMMETVFGIACDIVFVPETNRLVSMPRSSAALTAEPLPAPPIGRLRCDRLCCGYGQRCIVDQARLTIPAGRMTAIVGPNASGKSTLLRTFARLLKPMSGTALLDDRSVVTWSHRKFAQRVALLSQDAAIPDGVTVEDLVAVGRYPYQRWYRQWSHDDQKAVDEALAATGVEHLRWKPVDAISGGQRQRAWLAMALAQQTKVLLLDEPTTFLDIAHQVEMLDLVWTLNRREGRTIVMVVHDLSQACRYADHIVVMKNGQIVATGAPATVLTPELVRDVFGVESSVVEDPMTGRPLIIPEQAVAADPTVAQHGGAVAASQRSV